MSSYRVTPPNILFIDQFSVFDTDGFSKKSGLIYPTHFEIKLWKDCVVDSTTVTLGEIGTSGEYSISFTPDEIGFYELEIHCLWNHEIWAVAIECKPDLATPKIIDA